jgi:hypothetical protein
MHAFRVAAHKPLPPAAASANMTAASSDGKTCHCAWCGRFSLRGDGERRVEKSECSIERAGFCSSDVQLYVQCQGCGERFTIECLESIAKCLDSETFDDIHDPLGVWWSYKRRVWKKNEPTLNFVPSHGNEATSFVQCITCEDMELPPTVDPIPSELKGAAAVDRSEPFMHDRRHDRVVQL